MRPCGMLRFDVQPKSWQSRFARFMRSHENACLTSRPYNREKAVVNVVVLKPHNLPGNQLGTELKTLELLSDSVGDANREFRFA